MRGPKLSYLALAVLLLFSGSERLNAQTIGYGEALGQLAAACGKDIEKFCKKFNLGGGEIAECLEQHYPRVSSRCKTTSLDMAALLKKRARARKSVTRICELDRLKFCGDVQPGDGNLMACFEKTKYNVSYACQQAIVDAGYNVTISAGRSTDKIHLSSTDIISSLQGVETAVGISAAGLRRLAARAVRDPSRANPVDRPPLSEQLGKLAQVTIAVQFDNNSARINPNSFSAIGLLADAMYHPYLQGYCFLIVGHTDAKGGRENNLALSQRRADSIRAAMIDPFALRPGRIAAVGLGEEQLLDSSHPFAAENRRVQLINIGKQGANAECPDRPEKVIK
jgi:OmpA-OmpF porin, OOP family